MWAHSAERLLLKSRRKGYVVETEMPTKMIMCQVLIFDKNSSGGYRYVQKYKIPFDFLLIYKRSLHLRTLWYRCQDEL